MYFADEIRPAKGILPDKKGSVDKGQLKLAVDLIERMQGTFDHSAYHDRYRERLMAIVDKKRKGETITRSGSARAPRAGRPDGGARGESQRSRRQGAQGAEGAREVSQEEHASEVAQQVVSIAAMLSGDGG